MIELNDPRMTDEEYRDVMVRHGVYRLFIERCAGERLDSVGNIVDVYRTDMATQNPAKYLIQAGYPTRGVISSEMVKKFPERVREAAKRVMEKMR